jgi:hypothetical protein
MTNSLDKVSSVQMKEDGAQQADNELQQELRNYVPHTTEEKKLVRKIDMFLMPMLWIMYILNYVDRTNIVSMRHPDACQLMS